MKNSVLTRVFVRRLLSKRKLRRGTMKSSILRILRATLVATSGSCGTSAKLASTVQATTRILLALIAITGTMVSAQQQPRGMYENYATVPTEIPGIHTFMEPPAAFDALAATDQELAMYGFPPRPDKIGRPRQYEIWATAMKAAKIRWKGPLKATGLHATGPRMHAGAQIANVIKQNVVPNPDWSGFENTVDITKYNDHSSFSEVVSLFVVPTVADAGEESGCSALGTSGIVNLTLGIDAPTLQGGVIADNPGWVDFGGCSVYAPVYYAEIGAGTSDDIIQEFNVNPGDMIVAMVWDTSPTTGYVYLSDYATFSYATYAITLTPILGNSAEFLMARVISGGVLAPLPNYGAGLWTQVAAEDFAGHTFGPGTNSGTTYQYQMTDDAGDQLISVPFPYTQSFVNEFGLNEWAIEFRVGGCAQEVGCTP
jgi:Peptidase A4 family